MPGSSCVSVPVDTEHVTHAEDELPSEAEVRQLLAAASERAPTGVRNRALVALLYASGLRLGEALALRPEDVSLARATLHVRGVRAREVQLFPVAQPYLETWLALRARKGLAGRHLFTTLAGEPLAAAYVRAMLARLARRAGLTKRVHAHLLRHGHAARLAAQGVGAEELARQLGHAAGRGTRRALARFGLAPSGAGRRRLSEASFTLDPAPGTVRAVLRGPGTREPVPRPERGARVVRRWTPPEL